MDGSCTDLCLPRDLFTQPTTVDSVNIGCVFSTDRNSKGALASGWTRQAKLSRVRVRLALSTTATTSTTTGSALRLGGSAILFSPFEEKEVEEE